MGQRVVEVTAAANRGMSESRPEEAAPQHPAQPAPPAPAPAPAPARAARPATDGSIEPIVARLRAAGLDGGLAAAAAGAIPRSRRREVSSELLRRAMAHAVETLSAGDDVLGCEVFVGPAGVGKTTTVAKIAAQQRALHGVRLGLVSADGFRIGAIEQLRQYADIIGLPFKVTTSAGELAETLDSLAGGPPVLIDTAGRAPRDQEMRELFALLGEHPGVRTHLVLSAATGLREADRLLNAYAPARPARVALTRLDEADALGPLVGLLRDRGLPISFLSTGQRVPEDLARATAPVLAAHLLGEASAATGEPA
jgi:flagellar biosynthesis protein FlhF